MSTSMTYDSLINDIETYLDRDDDTLIAMIPEFITLGELRCAREVKNLGIKTAVTALFQPGQSIYLKPNYWLETISINFGNAEGFSTTLREATAGVCTLTFSSPHSFAAGDDISVFNVDSTNYNGNFTVTSVTQYSVIYDCGVVFTEASIADTGGFASPPLEERTALLPRSIEYCNYFWQNRTRTGEPRFYADYNYTNYLIVPTPKIAYPFEILMYSQPIFLSTTNTTNYWTMYARDLLLYACLLETAPYLKTDARIQTWQDRFDRAAGATKKQNQERINDASMMRME